MTTSSIPEAAVDEPRPADATDRAEPATGRARLVAVVFGIAAWVALIAAAAIVGNPIQDQTSLHAPPLLAEVDPLFWPRAPVVLALGLLLAWVVPRWCATLGWRRVLLLAMLVALGWGVALALVRGPSGIDRGLDGIHEYPAVVERAENIGMGRFVDTFTDPEVLGRYPVHVEGHPLGVTLVFIGLDRVGLGGVTNAARFVLLVGVTAVPATLIAVREVAGERRARQAAPFLALAPGLIWMVSSADAMFAGVVAWATALIVLATAERASPRRRAVLGVAGGLVFGMGIFLSYGLTLAVLVPVAVVLARRRWWVLAWAAVGGVLVVGAFALGGFWWFDGLAATRVRYEYGVASTRPFRYFAYLGNPAAFAIICGPAVAAALVWVRDRRLWLLVGAGLATVVLADASGLSKAETERIWLPFMPWVLVLCAGLADRAGARQGPDVRNGDGSAPSAAADGALVTAPSTTGDTAPVPVPTWSRLAGVLLVAQVLTAVVVESYVRTPW